MHELQEVLESFEMLEICYIDFFYKKDNHWFNYNDLFPYSFRTLKLQTPKEWAISFEILAESLEE